MSSRPNRSKKNTKKRGSVTRINGDGADKAPSPAKPKRVRRTITDKAEELACKLMLLRTVLAQTRQENAALQQEVADQGAVVARLRVEILQIKTDAENSGNRELLKQYGLPETFNFQPQADGSYVVEHDEVSGQLEGDPE